MLRNETLMEYCQKVIVKLFFIRVQVILFLGCFFSLVTHASEPYPAIAQILKLPEDQIDLGVSALVIEKLYHTDINITSSLKKIDEIVRTIQKMPEYGDSSLEKMGTVLKYFYTPSEWNQYKVYQYDLDDLTGQKNPVSTVHYLLNNRYGNCLSLPTLLTVVGQRLGVDIKLAIAPSHVYAHYKGDDGSITNIEATSGTLLSDSSYIRSLGIHPDAISNEIYLQSLSNKQAVAVLLVELSRHYMHKKDYENAEKIANLALSHHPKLTRAMLVKGNIYSLLLQNELARLKSINQPIGVEQRRYLDPLYQNNIAWFEKAEELGWRQPPPDFDEKYKQSMERFKNRR
jgi:regulator of sirC expression with transglutaminase-like and TPR domain